MEGMLKNPKWKHLKVSVLGFTIVLLVVTGMASHNKYRTCVAVAAIPKILVFLSG